MLDGLLPGTILPREGDFISGELDGDAKFPIIAPATIEPATIAKLFNPLIIIGPATIAKPVGTNIGVDMIPADKAQPQRPIPTSAPMPTPLLV